MKIPFQMFPRPESGPIQNSVSARRMMHFIAQADHQMRDMFEGFEMDSLMGEVPSGTFDRIQDRVHAKLEAQAYEKFWKMSLEEIIQLCVQIYGWRVVELVAPCALHYTDIGLEIYYTNETKAHAGRNRITRAS